MAWCRQATSHYLNQCWSNSILSYNITWGQWGKHYLSETRVKRPKILQEFYHLPIFLCSCGTVEMHNDVVLSFFNTQYPAHSMPMRIKYRMYFRRVKLCSTTYLCNCCVLCDMDGLTHWDWGTHICVSKLTIIGSDNGLLPSRRQAIMWTNYGMLSIGPWGTNLSEIFIEIQTFSLRKCIWKCCLENGGHFVSASMC